MNETSPRRICLAPMMDWTDQFYRYFLRQISSQFFLYTEMINTGAILRGDQKRHLEFNEIEHPVALQLGGSQIDDLAKCAEIAQKWGYDEVNLNVGCPSDRVQSGRFGACLMKEADHVAAIVEKMKSVTDIPITVKTRIGIDKQDSWEFFYDFIKTVNEGGCDLFIVHARKAWLKGLSPKENREVPPLDYETVYKLKKIRPELEIIINGGVKTHEECEEHLKFVDGVMIGREAYGNPYLWSSVDEKYYGQKSVMRTREEVIQEMIPYIKEKMSEGHPFHRAARHMLGLYHGVSGGRAYRRMMSENMTRSGAGVHLLEEWLDSVKLRGKNL